LVDSMPCHKSAFDEVLRPFGISVTIEDIAGRSTKEIIADLLSGTLDEFQQQAVCRAKTDTAVKIMRSVGKKLLLPSASEVVQSLSATVPVALCTSASMNTVSFVLSVLLGDCNFATVVTSADVRYAKPHPQTYELAIQRLGLSPSICLVVEDSESGVVAGHAAGCDVAHLTPHCTKASHCVARHHINALSDILPLIR
jgi:HAD superfamily hydrolase (TIGR01509 family)